MFVCVCVSVRTSPYRRYLNARSTFAELLAYGTIPVVNENDTVAVQELRFGDNDRYLHRYVCVCVCVCVYASSQLMRGSATDVCVCVCVCVCDATRLTQVATLVQADYLFLMTDVDCLYDKNPKVHTHDTHTHTHTRYRHCATIAYTCVFVCVCVCVSQDHPDAQPIYEVENIASLVADTSTSGTQWGTGGMATKLTAGRIATAAGCTMVSVHTHTHATLSLSSAHQLACVRRPCGTPKHTHNGCTHSCISQVICNSQNPEAILKVLAGERVDTKLYPGAKALEGRKRWILSVSAVLCVCVCIWSCVCVCVI